MRAALVGLGAVGVRVARQLMTYPEVESLVVFARDSRAVRSAEGFDERVVLRPGRHPRVPAGTDVVILARPDGASDIASGALAAGAHVVAAIDDPHQVRQLLELDLTARAVGRSVVVGATMAPGLSCLLARCGAAQLDSVCEVHVASFGTGGRACARRHHASLSATATEWYAGGWRRRSGGSGRELVWFPDPVGGADCYRARLVDPLLLAPAFPGVRTVTARRAATRRDRLTAALPMLRPPHLEGTVGATRVEVRGFKAGAAEVVVLGSFGRPALVAGTVAGVAAVWAGSGRTARSGAAGLAEMVARPVAFLRDVADRGIRLEVFDGSRLLPQARAS
jgi:saccharopine dehydrogenase-like NADP-dependent oxidoreductase